MFSPRCHFHLGYDIFDVLNIISGGVIQWYIFTKHEQGFGYKPHP